MPGAISWSASMKSARPSATIGSTHSTRWVSVWHAVVADRALPRLVLGPAEQVAGVREGRPERAGRRVLVGVPADVVEVQVGAHHRVDLSTRDAEALEILEEALGQVAEHVEVALAPGADARIDHDHPPGACTTKPWKFIRCCRRGWRSGDAAIASR
jgi:hypothetical protein